MNLFQLTQSYQEVLSLAEQLDEGTLKDTLDSINEAIDVKVENTAYVIKTLEANVAMIEVEAKRLAAMKSAQTNNIKNLKLYIQESMEKVGLDKVQGKTIKVAIQNNGFSVLVSNEKALTTYLVEQPSTLDKKSLLADLKSGMEIDGAELQQTRSIRIK